MRAPRLTPTLLLGLALALAGCADDDPGSAPAASSTRTTETPPGGSATSSPTPEPEPEASPDAEALDWEPVPGPASATVTVGDGWTLTQTRRDARLVGEDRVTVTAPDGHRISHALLDEGFAVVVAEDDRAARPDSATVVDLESGDRWQVDGRSDVPTTTGGTWALGEGRLLHATVEDGDYCLATVDLGDRSAEVSWCAPARHGFSDARITPAGTSLLTFDDSRPSCRTVVRVADGVVPFTDVPECLGWDGLVLDGAELWSVVPKATRVEEATFHVTADGETEDLGPGTSGSLTWCGEAAYFVRDPQRSVDPARLMAWSPGDGLRVAYETEATGRAFLGEPRCGGGRLTVSAFTAAGDEQVTAEVD